MTNKDPFKDGVYSADIRKGNCLVWGLFYKLKYPRHIKLKIVKGHWRASLLKGRIPHVYWYDERYDEYYHFHQRRYLKKWNQFYYHEGNISSYPFLKLDRIR